MGPTIGSMTVMTRILFLFALLSTSAAMASDERPVIVAFGDSLTAGYNLPEGLGYAPQLEDALRREGIAATVVDAGVSGDTTSGGRQRLNFVLEGLEQTPDLLLLELGGNDVLRAIDPSVTRDNLDWMIAEVQSRGIDVVLLGMRAPRNYDPAYVEAFETIFTDLAAKYDVPLYPFFLEGLEGVEGTIQSDGIHPTFRGIKLMVDGSLPTILSAL